MEKKKYTTPGIIKVELRHEQAVLAICSAGVTSVLSISTRGCSTVGCRQYRTTGDLANTS